MAAFEKYRSVYTHDELMETCPLYREIGESQIGDRRPEAAAGKGVLA